MWIHVRLRTCLEISRVPRWKNRDPLVGFRSSHCDLLLQPFSGPLTDVGNNVILVREKFRHIYNHVCQTNAKFVGCPALYSNKVGRRKTTSPTISAPPKFDTKFSGCCDLRFIGKDGRGQQLKDEDSPIFWWLYRTCSYSQIMLTT